MSLLFHFIGYNPKTIVFQLDSNLNVGIVQLSSTNALGEALISTERSLITKNSEKTVINVAQSPLNQTGTGC